MGLADDPEPDEGVLIASNRRKSMSSDGSRLGNSADCRYPNGTSTRSTDPGTPVEPAAVPGGGGGGGYVYDGTPDGEPEFATLGKDNAGGGEGANGRVVNGEDGFVDDAGVPGELDDGDHPRVWRW